MTWLSQYEESRKLPLGHVGRREAEERIEREYSLSRLQEKAFFKKWKGPKRLSSLPEALLVANRICGALYVTPLKEVTVGPFEGVMRYAGAYYNRRNIFVRLDQCDIVTLLHELAHHVCYMEKMFKGGWHGEDFLMVEQMIFDLVLDQPGLVIGTKD